MFVSDIEKEVTDMWQKINTPKIVCLCGSTKFRKEFEQVTFVETMNGHIVLSVGCFSHADHLSLAVEQKKALDELHLRKIDLAHEVFVVNPNNYLGESTINEIKYALLAHKPLRWLVEPGTKLDEIKRSLNGNR